MQNRVITTKFLKDLDSLNKSRNLSTKALQNESVCFRIKFGKHESSISPSGSEASDVKMYETHMPGFCFHRNGQYRTPNMKSESSDNEITMKLYPYVFSQGEIDPEKVVCMHLLTVQTVEMPNNLNAKKMINQAIFKSFAEEELDYENVLPIYLLESEFYKVNKLSKDGMTEIKLINKRIALLINIIMQVLEDTNNEKYLKIIELARNKTEIFKLIKHKKLREMFESCEKSSVLTDLKCYKAVNFTNFNVGYIKKIKKIRMPEKCITLEKCIGQIRNRLLKEIQIVCRKSDTSQLILGMQNEKTAINLKEADHNDSLIRKVEFSEKTQTTSAKRKANAKMDDKINFFKLNNVNIVFPNSQQQIGINDKKLEKERSSFLLKKMNNSQRIRIGKKVAELKSKTTILGLEENRVSVDGIIQEVLSKRSLENLFSCSTDEESRIICNSFENNQNEYNKGNSERKLNEKTLESDALLSKNQKNNTSYIFTKIKQDIINKETDKKIAKFLAK